MMIDPFAADWLEQLAKRLADIPEDTSMYLLIDGAFIPGLFRSRAFKTADSGPVKLLFEALPGCNEETRDVSPFLLPVKKISRSVSLVLEKCSGWPMVSAIETTESCAELCERLAAWCVIEADDHRFNFRFPDTRRLPKISDTLTPRQRAAFCGPASRWSYIGRAGNWEHLNVDGKGGEIASQPKLDDAQFGALVGDSEADEALTQLAYRGFEQAGLPSVHHQKTNLALCVADAGRLAQPLRVDWCEFVLKHEHLLSESDASAGLVKWLASQA